MAETPSGKKVRVTPEVVAGTVAGTIGTVFMPIAAYLTYWKNHVLPGALLAAVTLLAVVHFWYQMRAAHRAAAKAAAQEPEPEPKAPQGRADVFAQEIKKLQERSAEQRDETRAKGGN